MEVLAERYELQRQVGSGGAATVWLAHDRILDVPRALKFVEKDSEPKQLARLAAEARAMARLRHQHVLPVHDLETDDERTYIVMDYVPAGSAEDRIEAGGAYPAEEAVQLILEVLDALDCAHRSDIIHRDVKPSNILLGENGALLADFGVARLSSRPKDRATRTHFSLGTMAYMAPEQRLDARNVGPEADLYAVGATLYELLTTKNPIDLFIAGDDSARWAGVPLPIRPFIRRATRYNPLERFPDAATARSELESVLAALADAPDEPQASPQDELDRARERLATWYRQRLSGRADVLRDLAHRLQAGEPGVADQVRRHAHDLKGSGASFGYPLITEAAREVELGGVGSLHDRIRRLLFVVLEAAWVDPEETPAAIAVVVADPSLRRRLGRLLAHREDVVFSDDWTEADNQDVSQARVVLVDTQNADDGLAGHIATALGPQRVVVLGGNRAALAEMGVRRVLPLPLDPVSLVAALDQNEQDDEAEPHHDHEWFCHRLLEYQAPAKAWWSMLGIVAPAPSMASATADLPEGALVGAWGPTAVAVLIPDQDAASATELAGRIAAACPDASVTVCASQTLSPPPALAEQLLREARAAALEGPGSGPSRRPWVAGRCWSWTTTRICAS